MQIGPCHGDSGSKNLQNHTAITGETLSAGLMTSEGKTKILTEEEQALEFRGFEHAEQPYPEADAL